MFGNLETQTHFRLVVVTSIDFDLAVDCTQVVDPGGPAEQVARISSSKSGGWSTPETQNPKPEILHYNLNPGTLSLGPSNLILTPYALNPEPSSFNPQP